MNNQIVEEVIEWNSRPFSGGYAGLRELGEKDFTGAVTNGTAWLFLLNGRVVAAVDGAVGACGHAVGPACADSDQAVPPLGALEDGGRHGQRKHPTGGRAVNDVDKRRDAATVLG